MHSRGSPRRTELHRPTAGRRTFVDPSARGVCIGHTRRTNRRLERSSPSCGRCACHETCLREVCRRAQERQVGADDFQRYLRGTRHLQGMPKRAKAGDLIEQGVSGKHFCISAYPPGAGPARHMISTPLAKPRRQSYGALQPEVPSPNCVIGSPARGHKACKRRLTPSGSSSMVAPWGVTPGYQSSRNPLSLILGSRCSCQSPLLARLGVYHGAGDEAIMHVAWPKYLGPGYRARGP
jgi:hypothetical protein